MAMDRVLETSELLGDIFSYMDKASMSRSARVCKAWSDLALKSLWSDIDKVQVLFSLLAPVVVNAKRNFKFTRRIKKNDWNTFNKYAQYVNRLELCGKGNSLMALYKEVSRTCKIPVLLPNLRCLKIDCEHDTVSDLYITLFLHGDLQEIYLIMDHNDRLENLLDNITSRSFNIMKLTLDTYWPADRIEEKLVPFFHSLKSLQCVGLLKFILTGPLFEALSKHQNLEKIFVLHDNVFCVSAFDATNVGSFIAEAENFVHFRPVIQDGAFPQLRVLEMTSNLLDATKLFADNFVFSNITELHLMIPRHKGGEDYRRLFDCLSTCLCSIATMGIHSEVWDNYEVDSNYNDTVTLDVFCSIFKLKSMERFFFWHCKPLAFTKEGFTKLLLSWIDVKGLSFDSELISASSDASQPSAFQHLTFYCPSLESLISYINTFYTSVLTSPSAESWGIEICNVRSSPLGSAQEVVISFSECDIRLKYSSRHTVEEK